MARLVLLLLSFCITGQARAQGLREGIHELALSSGPHPPADAPDVVAHVPHGFDAAQPLEVVVFLHGFDCCARSLMASTPTPCRTGEAPHRAWDLAGIHEQASKNSILLVPQLAYLARTARGHRFTSSGAFDRMLDDSLGQLLGSTRPGLRSVTLVAHSGGYGAAVPILRDRTRKAPVLHVVLLDALYAGADVFAAWALEQPQARLVSLHTAQPETTQQNELMARRLHSRDVWRDVTGSLSEAVHAHPLVVARVKTPHGDVPARHLADILRGLPLAPRAEEGKPAQASTH
jgi:hypothetical protein